MEPLLAVDVAILPPPDVSDAAAALSAGLPEAESKGLHLDALHLPHITLTQQFIPASDVTAAAATVAGVLRHQTPLSLAVTGSGRGSSSVWMRIRRTRALLELHETLMAALQPFERTGGTTSAFAGGDARTGDVTWVSGFRRHSSFARFTPHITLGHASALPAVQPRPFTASTIALCHLGRFCSCREILASWSLPVG